MSRLMPRVLPGTWKQIEAPFYGTEAYVHQSGLAVIVSIDQSASSSEWLHVSCSRRGRLPSWEDLKMVKAVFVGPDKEAFQVLPPDAEYINDHPFTLHLWHCLDGRRVMDL